MDDPEHLLIEVLHPEAVATEVAVGQLCPGMLIEVAGMALDRDLRSVDRLHEREEVLIELAEVVDRYGSGTAATIVDL